MKYLKIVKNFLFYMFILFLFAYILVTLFMPTKVVDIFGFQISTVSTKTESMLPTIKPGDLIVITKTDEDHLKTDDIISFYDYINCSTDQETNVKTCTEIKKVHRIKNIRDNNTYITKGDNNDLFDTIHDENGNPIELGIDRVIGKYQFRIPLIGAILTSLRKPVLLGLIVINITIIVIVIKVIKSSKKDQKDENKLME